MERGLNSRASNAKQEYCPREEGVWFIFMLHVLSDDDVSNYDSIVGDG